jgi:hypothetical protein
MILKKLYNIFITRFCLKKKELKKFIKNIEIPEVGLTKNNIVIINDSVKKPYLQKKLFDKFNSQTLHVKKAKIKIKTNQL